MVFSSLIFIYAFLPFSLICLYACRGLKAKNTALLLCSLIFFAWAGPIFILPLLLMSLSSWIFALRIEKARGGKAAKRALFFSCAVDVGLLCFFKFAAPVCSLFGPLPDCMQNASLPIGVSFYTFRLVTYTADVYRADSSARKRFTDVLLYAALYHLCAAGPVAKFSATEFELFRKRSGRGELPAGISRFCVGLAKKTLLATPCGALADVLVPAGNTASDASRFAADLEALSGLSVLGVWLGVFAFMLYICLDFSAYSDMAVGLGLMIGLHYPENFNCPYVSRSVTEFWRRWHITLGMFFRDYVYIPLGGNRRGGPRNALNLLIVWALTGLWHGASLNFVVWGLWSFVFIFAERHFTGRLLDRLPAVFSHIYLLAFVFAGWIIFRFTDPRLGFTVFAGLFGGNGNALSDFASLTLLKNNIFLMTVCAAACTPLAREAGKRLTRYAGNRAGFEQLRKITVYSIIPAILLLLSTASLVGASYSPFIYFRF